MASYYAFILFLLLVSVLTTWGIIIKIKHWKETSSKSGICEQEIQIIGGMSDHIGSCIKKGRRGDGGGLNLLRTIHLPL